MARWMSVGAAALVLAGCGGGSDETITIYLRQRLGPDGPPGQIAPVLAPVERDARPAVPPARQAVIELLVGPSPDERGRGVEPTLPAGTRLRSVRVAAGTAVVDLDGVKLRDAYADGAIVYSLSSVPGVERVSLRFQGRPCCVFDHRSRVIRLLSTDLYRGWQGEPCSWRTWDGAVRCRNG